MKNTRLAQAFFYNNPDNYPPIINGIRLLVNAGWKVELYCRADGKDWNVQYPANASIHRIKPSGRNSWLNYGDFLREAFRGGSKNASAFIAHDMHALVPARLLAVRHRRPLIYHCYDYSGNGYAQTLSGRIVKGFQFGFARTAAMMTVPDEGLADIVHKELHLRKKPLVVANSPISVPEGNGGALRQALSCRGLEFEKIVFRQGRIGPGHAIEATIRSIPQWASRRWGFVVMGIAESSYVDSLGELAASVGVEKQFVVLPPVSYDDVHRFTTDADLGHALYEPIHINNLHISGACKIQEYMAAGLPLLVSDTPGLRSLIDRFDCGIAADEVRPEGIATSINTLLKNPFMARKKGAAARAAFENQFCFERQFAPALFEMQRLTSR